MPPQVAPTSDGSGYWYAVALQPHADALAKAHLERQGFSVFAPMMLRTVRHARQFINKHAPRFPGYLFVQLDRGRDRWLAVNSTRWVSGLLNARDGPARVPAALHGGDGSTRRNDSSELLDILVLIGACLCLLGYADWPVKTGCDPARGGAVRSR